MTKSKIILSTGGTGGHVFPAIALAEELKSRGAEVVFATDKRGKKYLENKSYPYFVTSVASGSKIKLAVSLFQAIIKMVQINPSHIVGFGGYASFPAMFVGKLMNKKLFIHEQNSVLGRVNRYFAGAAKLATSFPDMNRICVGNPVRSEIKFSELPSDEKINILVIGGSQGAKIFSDVLPPAFGQFKDKIKITQQVVEADLERIKNFYDENNVEAEVAPFFSDMPNRYANCHLVIARAGSSTIFELAKAGRPAIFVPLGIAADNHQQINAEAVLTTGGGWMLLEKDFTLENFSKLLSELILAPEKINKAAKNITKFAVDASAKKLADFILN